MPTVPSGSRLSRNPASPETTSPRRLGPGLEPVLQDRDGPTFRSAMPAIPPGHGLLPQPPRISSRSTRPRAGPASPPWSSGDVDNAVSRAPLASEDCPVSPAMESFPHSDIRQERASGMRATQKGKPPRGLGGTTPRRLPVEDPGDDRLSRQRHYHGPGGLNGRVRDGNGCDPAGMVAGKSAGGRSGPAGRGGSGGRSRRDRSSRAAWRWPVILGRGPATDRGSS